MREGNSKPQQPLEEVALFTEILDEARGIAARQGSELVLSSHFLMAVLSRGEGAVVFSDRGGDPDVAVQVLSEKLQDCALPVDSHRIGVCGSMTHLLDDLYRQVSGRASPAVRSPDRKSLIGGLLDIVDEVGQDDPLCRKALASAYDPAGFRDGSVEMDLDELLSLTNGEPEGLLRNAGGEPEHPESPDDQESALESWGRSLEKEDTSRAGRPRPKPPGRANRESGADMAAAIERSLRCLGTAAAEGRLDPVVGRDTEIRRVISALMRRRKSSVVLHGQAGVGKTAIAEGVAIAMRAADAPIVLRNRPIYELSLSDLISGTRYRGDFEERITAAVRRIIQEKAIVFIDEIHMIMGLGTSQTSGMDAANILKPALARGEISVIGATTSEELDQIRHDKAMMRRLEFIEVVEPSLEDMRNILERSAWPYLGHHGLGRDDEALEAILRICADSPGEAKFPDKAFDLLDRACVWAVQRNDSVLREDHVHEAAVECGMAARRGVTTRDARWLQDLRAALSRAAPESRDAVDSLVEGLGRHRLFAGARSTPPSWLLEGGAEEIDDIVTVVEYMTGAPAVRFEGARLSDLFSLGALLGTPGMHGPARYGTICQAIDRRSDTILVFEDIEQSHPSVQDLVSTIMRTGTFKTTCGRDVSARRCRIILTRRMARSREIGFLGGESAPERPGPLFGQESLARSIPHLRIVPAKRAGKEASVDALTEEVLASIASPEMRSALRQSLTPSLSAIASTPPDSLERAIQKEVLLLLSRADAPTTLKYDRPAGAGRSARKARAAVMPIRST